MKYAVVNANGLPTAFYDDPEVAPSDAIEISDATWADWIENQQTRKWQDGELKTVVAPVLSAQNIALNQLLQSDPIIFRALEVLIDVLLAKGTIVATDFPPVVRTLYLQRKALRTVAGVP